MIQINLLDQTTTSKRAKKSVSAGPVSMGGPLGNIILTAAIAVMVLVNAGAGWYAWDKVHASGKELRGLKGDLDTLSQEIEQKEAKAEEIRHFSEVVNNQMDILRSLDPSDRILWAEKLNMLADLMPENVFLNQVEVMEQVKMVETEQSRQAREVWSNADREKRGDAPKAVERPVINYVVRLSGVALGESQLEQFDNVKHFQEALINYSTTNSQGESRRFMDGFLPDIYFETVQSSVYPDREDLNGSSDIASEEWMYYGMPVNRFTFSLTTHSWGMDENAPVANQAADARSGNKTVASAR